MSYAAFRDRFRFTQKKVHHIGVERECFITNAQGVIVPRAHEVLAKSKGTPLDGSERSNQAYQGSVLSYELSNCQLELRTQPHPSLTALRRELEDNDRELDMLLRTMQLRTLHTEVGPEDMPLEVYPDPTGRYQLITQNMPRETLLAACRVIGTHVHIGMEDHAMALHTYNYVCRYYHDLCERGNGSFGERLGIYRTMAPDFKPEPYADWQTFYETACAKGFSEDPRTCWTLVRMSVHGTIEFRMFGATDSVDRIIAWAERCQVLCQEALVAA